MGDVRYINKKAELAAINAKCIQDRDDRLNVLKAHDEKDAKWKSETIEKEAETTKTKKDAELQEAFDKAAKARDGILERWKNDSEEFVNAVRQSGQDLQDSLVASHKRVQKVLLLSFLAMAAVMILGALISQLFRGKDTDRIFSKLIEETNK